MIQTLMVNQSLCCWLFIFNFGPLCAPYSSGATVVKLGTKTLPLQNYRYTLAPFRLVGRSPFIIDIGSLLSATKPIQVICIFSHFLFWTFSMVFFSSSKNKDNPKDLQPYQMHYLCDQHTWLWNKAPSLWFENYKISWLDWYSMSASP